VVLFASGAIGIQDKEAFVASVIHTNVSNRMWFHCLPSKNEGILRGFVYGFKVRGRRIWNGGLRITVEFASLPSVVSFKCWCSNARLRLLAVYIFTLETYWSSATRSRTRSSCHPLTGPDFSTSRLLLRHRHTGPNTHTALSCRPV
jgi:hypothetical protein